LLEIRCCASEVAGIQGGLAAAKQNFYVLIGRLSGGYDRNDEYQKQV
jgi:hypothetical protein